MPKFHKNVKKFKKHLQYFCEYVKIDLYRLGLGAVCPNGCIVLKFTADNGLLPIVREAPASLRISPAKKPIFVKECVTYRQI